MNDRTKVGVVLGGGNMVLGVIELMMGIPAWLVSANIGVGFALLMAFSPGVIGRICGWTGAIIGHICGRMGSLVGRTIGRSVAALNR